MSADDVVFSLGRQMDPENAAAWAQNFENVSSVRKTGPLQVTVKLKKPDSQFRSTWRPPPASSPPRPG